MIKIDKVKVNEVTPDEVVDILKKDDENTVLIDVREKEEIELGVIKQAIHIPLNEIPDSLDNFEKDKHYIMICRSGNRSNTASIYLQEKGFKVSNMIGGMIDWQGKVQ